MSQNNMKGFLETKTKGKRSSSVASLIKDELEAAKRLEKILNKLEELEQIKEASKTDSKQRETITAKAKDEKDKTLNHQSMSPEGEPYVASEEEDKKLRSMWKEDSELFVKFERYGWITGKVMKISLDSQGEWLQVGRPGAKKDVSRNSSFVRPILSEDILERLGVVKPEAQDNDAGEFDTNSGEINTESKQQEKPVPGEETERKEKQKPDDTRDSHSPPLIDPTEFDSPVTSTLLSPRAAARSVSPASTAREKALSGLKSKVESGSIKNLQMIEEKHAQFELVFALLHGLKHSVVKTRKEAETTSKLCKEYEKFNFSHSVRGVGIPLPGHIKLRGFEFKVYAPRVFNNVRKAMLVNDIDFFSSICFNSYVEFISNSKSGAFFYYSNDGKYMIKTIEQAEAKCLIELLHAYSKHLNDNPESKLCKIYGLYRLSLNHSLPRMGGRKKFYFIIMESVFYTARYIHLIYDLKGSSYRREATDKDIDRDPTQNFTCTVLKDNDLRESGQKITIGEEKAKEMQKQLEADAKFLQSQGIIDYSLLIGIHYPGKPDPREVKASPASGTLANDDVPIWEQNAPSRGRSPTIPHDARAGYKSELVNVGIGNVDEAKKKFVQDMTRSQRNSVVDRRISISKEKKKEVGLESARKTTRHGRQMSIFSKNVNKEVYFVGIIDILVRYNLKKKGEYMFKSKMMGLGDTISVIPPEKYMERFVAFANSFIE
mmetsp:Transcript_38591/g.64783  ORF Transcript_38591/g.64783 Transcript_38591/m.64783 type:complete len:717 (+) Transcript_38591:351-2501(+)